MFCGLLETFLFGTVKGLCGDFATFGKSFGAVIFET